MTQNIDNNNYIVNNNNKLYNVLLLSKIERH